MASARLASTRIATRMTPKTSRTVMMARIGQALKALSLRAAVAQAGHQ